MDNPLWGDTNYSFQTSYYEDTSYFDKDGKELKTLSFFDALRKHEVDFRNIKIVKTKTDKIQCKCFISKTITVNNKQVTVNGRGYGLNEDYSVAKNQAIKGAESHFIKEYNKNAI